MWEKYKFDILGGVDKRFALGFLLFSTAASFGANIVFYTSQADFQAAINGLASQTITFDDLATGPYNPLVTQGVTFSGDLRQGLIVEDQASFTYSSTLPREIALRAGAPSILSYRAASRQ
jgi:hypothetical protein